MGELVLRIVPQEPVACWPWELRSLGGFTEHPRGAQCQDCRREVAAPRDAGSQPIVCIYCGMDQGLVEAIDRPLPEYEELWPW